MLGNIGAASMSVMRLKVLQKIVDSAPVAGVRAESSEQAARIAEACAEGGVASIEIAFTVPCARNVIRDLAQRFTTDEILIGAGTVLEPETARVATLSGAQFVVSPTPNPETARLCNRYQVPYIPGASTPKEVIEGMECAADIVKVFPAETLGPSFVKAVRGPLPRASLMPTGGVP